MATYVIGFPRIGEQRELKKAKKRLKATGLENQLSRSFKKPHQSLEKDTGLTRKTPELI